MVALNLAYDLANYTPADANPVQSNFQRIEQHVNQELINRDGTVAMTGQLRLVGNPENPLDAATKAYVDLLLPVGVMLPYPAPGTAPGLGVWAIADGATLQETEYPDLFARYGRAHGGTPGNFKLPDMRGMMLIGAGTGSNPEGSLGAAVGAHAGNKDAAPISHVHNAKHAHGATAADKDLNHFHTMRNHIHGATESGAGGHDHGLGAGAVLDYYQPGGTEFHTTSPGGQARANSGPWTPALDHQHTVTIGGPSDPYTSWLSEAQVLGNAPTTHNHTVTVAENDFNTQPAGEAALNRNLPPYVAIQFIIRVR